MASKPVISVVDDDPSVREGTMDLLLSKGFIAETFAGADEFLLAGDLQSVSCLITDVQMPGMTGLELHDRLVGSGYDIPTILITAYPNNADRARAERSGICCYLVKPYSDSELLQCIRSALKKPRRDTKET